MNTIQVGAVAFSIAMLNIIAGSTEDPAAGAVYDIVGSLWLALGGVFVLVLSWLANKANGWLSEKKKDAWWAGVLVRFNTALGDGLLAAKAQVDEKLRKAKSEDSPGGSKITEAELAQMKDLMWSFLKDRYGGMAGLEKALGVAVGGNVEQWVGSKINGAVNEAVSEDPS